MMTRKEFWSLIISELSSDNFSILLYNKKHLDGWGGWMDSSDDSREFVVAMNHPLGFETALHEYCHYLQWKNNPSLWEKSNDTYEVLFNWIEDKESNYSEEELDKSLHDILEIEHDCEKLSLEFAKINRLENFNRTRYIKAANAYLWHYHINRKFRTRPKKPIYNTKAMKSMSSKFIDNLGFYLDVNNLSQKQYSNLLSVYEDIEYEIHTSTI